MTDDHGDAEIDASAAPLDADSDDGHDTVQDASAASLGNRIDAVQGTMSTIGMRIDALVTSTTSYRSALSDRLSEYAELVNKASRGQAADLEEYRRATERTVAEVRRAVSTMDEGLLRLAAQVDELAQERVGTEESEGRRVISEVRSILESQDRLSDFLTTSLDRFGESVMAQIQTSNAAVSEGIAKLQLHVQQVADSDQLSTIVSDLAETRAAVDSLAARDIAGPLRAELEGSMRSVSDEVRAAIGRLAEADQSAAVRDQLAELRTAVETDRSSSVVDSVERVSEVLDRMSQQVAARDEHARVDHAEVLNTLVGVRNGLEELATRDIADPLRTELAPLSGSIERLMQQVDAGLARLQDTSRVDDALARVNEALLDVASGEVLGSLWDEFRALRDGIEAAADTQRKGAVAERHALVADVSAHVDRLVGALPAPETDPAVHALEVAIADLTQEVRTLLAAAEVPEADGGFADEVVLADEVFEPITAGLDELRRQLDALRGELSVAPVAEGLSGVEGQLDVLREELAAGLSVEPSPKLMDALASLHDDLTGLPDAIAVLPEIQRSLAELREAVADTIDTTAAVAEAVAQVSPPDRMSEPSEPWMASDVETERVPAAAGVNAADLLAELHDLRSAIDQVRARLDEGLVMEERDTLAPSSTDVVAVADEIASMRDLLAAEFDGLRAQISQGGVAPTPGAELLEGGSGAVFAQLDPDTIDLLREEIRASGGVSDSMVEEVSKELKALRRRLAVKADEKVLSDEQLDFIAEAVAKRLAK